MDRKVVQGWAIWGGRKGNPHDKYLSMLQGGGGCNVACVWHHQQRGGGRSHLPRCHKCLGTTLSQLTRSHCLVGPWRGGGWVQPSSPVFGSTSHCPVTQFPCTSIPLPSRVHSFSSTPPSQDIISLLTVAIHHPSRSIPVIKSSGIQTPVLLSWTSILSSQTFIPLSQTSIPFDTAQSLTAIQHHDAHCLCK